MIVMAEIIPLRPFVNALQQARRLGPNASAAIVRRVREELQAGRDGFAVAGELQRAAMTLKTDTPSPTT